jgi:hypothetical protein
MIVVVLVLIGIVFAACEGEDTEGELNVTPEEYSYAHFTVDVVRIGDFKGIGWYANGQFYLKVQLGAEEGATNVSGNGFGKAGYDGSGGPCINIGGWPVEYSVSGSFSEENCSMTIVAVESWPKTEAHAICLGSGAEVEGPPYSITLPNIKFDELKVKTTTTVTDEIVWLNTFVLTTGVGSEKLNCMFSDPPPETPQP